jgi:hypothetical protein
MENQGNLVLPDFSEEEMAGIPAECDMEMGQFSCHNAIQASENK